MAASMTLSEGTGTGRAASRRGKTPSTWRCLTAEFAPSTATLSRTTPGMSRGIRSGLDPLLKNRWVEIRRNGRSCFAQWQDVGPCGEDDFDFVFGRASKPRNTFDAKAGLDVSPAVWHHLGMHDNDLSAWRFVEAGGRSVRVPGPKSSPRSAIIAEAAAPGQRPIRPAATPACGRQRRSRASGSRAALSPPHPRPIG